MQNCDLGMVQVLSGFILQCLHRAAQEEPDVQGLQAQEVWWFMERWGQMFLSQWFIPPLPWQPTLWHAWPVLRAWYHGLNHYWFQFTWISLAVNCCSWGLWFTVSVRLTSGVWGAFWAQQPLYQVHPVPYKLGLRLFCYPFENIYCDLLSICMLECKTDQKNTLEKLLKIKVSESRKHSYYGKKSRATGMCSNSWSYQETAITFL